MYKVLIVDDEPIIVEGLKKIIKWNEYNCEVIATASDGLEAEKLVEELKPDIMFTDIRMPNKDGLTLIAALRSSFPNMQITVLTAHRDFEYAQKAIIFGVSRYLLKPSKMHELEEALTVMTNNIKKNKKKQVAEEDENNDQASSFVVNEALKYMEDNYKEKLVLDDVAAKVFVSKWHLSRLLKEYTNQGFSENLSQLRIAKAKKFLKDPSLSMSDISEMVGFSDPSHFSRTFKKITNKSAVEYRNTL